VWRHREADGEHYVYVEDTVRCCLAGYTVFNRLIEVDRRTDPHVRAPHSRYAPAYQRRGIATAVYEWGLQQGFCLVSGARQSAGAHALWLALGRRFRLGYVALRKRRMHYLGAEPAAALRDDLNTRLLLLGPGWSLDRLQALGLLQRPGWPPPRELARRLGRRAAAASTAALAQPRLEAGPTTPGRAVGGLRRGSKALYNRGLSRFPLRP
jgi:GNAT superfamily N-acetyltransferase